MYIHDALCTVSVCVFVCASVPHVCLIHCVRVCVCAGPSEAVTAGCEGRLSTAPV